MGSRAIWGVGAHGEFGKKVTRGIEELIGYKM